MDKEELYDLVQKDLKELEQTNKKISILRRFYRYVQQLDGNSL